MAYPKKNKNFRLRPGMLLLLCLLTVFGPPESRAQKKIKVTAKGSYEALDLTIDEVKQKAVEEAKHNAMVKAGIPQNVKVSDFLYTFEDNEQFRDVFQSFVSTETGADIIVEDVRELKRDINEFGNIFVEVEIDAVVIKHKKTKDPAFDFKVSGIRDVYYENDPLEFTFTPSRDGYLKIFNVSGSNAFVLYPYDDPEAPLLRDDSERLFLKNQTVAFPVNDRMEGYYFSIDDKNSRQENNLLIFVFTREDYPFLEEVTIENIMRWIFDIPPDRRAVQQWGIVLKK